MTHGPTARPVSRDRGVAASAPTAGASPFVRWQAPPRARGTVLLLHAGGWKHLDGGRSYRVSLMAAQARTLRSWGVRTGIVDYRAKRSGLGDVLAAYDSAQRRYDTKPICLWGESAGGTLALLAAERRTATSCVIAVGAPVDLVAANQFMPGGVVATLARAAFGATVQDLREFSAIVHGATIRARTLLAYALNDPLVPAVEGIRMAQLVPGSRLLLARPGLTRWVHSSVDVDDARHFLADAHGLLMGL